MNHIRYVVIVFICIGIGLYIISKLRKELPYNFEIVSIENGIAIVNIESWLKRDLDVTIFKKGESIYSGILDSESHSFTANDLEDTGEVVLRISRSDFLGKLKYRPFNAEYVIKNENQKYIILVGASIGNSWDLPNFPQRAGVEKFVFGNRIKYDFDKQAIIDPIIKYKIKPDAVIIKECSAYFPRNIENSAKKLLQWVSLLKENGIIPIIATTTPVKETHENKKQQLSIDHWNKLIRQKFGKDKHSYYILDLAKALQINSKNTFLKPNYYVEDGLHMTHLAYKEAFDPTLERLIKEIWPFLNK